MRPVSTRQTILVRAPQKRVFAAAAGIHGRDLAKATAFLPGIEESHGETGPWSTVGQQRLHVLSDGTSVHEELTAFADGEYYAYRITGFEGFFGMLATEGQGVWRFDWRGPEQTEIAWSYDFTPSGAMARVVLALFVKWLWAGYLMAGLKRVKQQAEERS